MKKIFAIILFFVSVISLQAQTFNKLYDFTGSPGSGENPYYTTPITDGTYIFGTTYYGGSTDDGTLFRINPDGSGFTVIHDFTGGMQGENPAGTPLMYNGKFYGTAKDGGTNDDGCVWSINTNGTGFTILHSFDELVDGDAPSCKLTLVGNTLYGTTEEGGVNDDGTVFRIDIDGANFQSLHTMDASTGPSGPDGGVVHHNGYLYGFSNQGSSTTGTGGGVYRIMTDGTGYEILHEFGLGVEEGAYGDPVIINDVIYGTTKEGGANNDGQIFSLNIDGSNFQTLYNFDYAGNGDGYNPRPQLVRLGNYLFGTTEYGGANDDGTIFAINMAGIDFTTIHSFDDGSNEGRRPRAGITLLDNVLYGFTRYGGASDMGAFYSFTPPFSIPTLTEWAAIILGGLTLLFGAWFIFRRNF